MLLAIETVVLGFSTDVAFKFYRIFANASLLARVPLLALMLLAPVACIAATFVGVTRNGNTASIALFTFCVVLMAAGVAYPYRYYNELETRLTRAEQTINDTKASLRKASEEVRERFSMVIHGKIQGRLALVSFLLGQLATGEVKPGGKANHLAKLQELINRIDEDLHRVAQPTTSVALAEMAGDLARDWSGLLTIELEIEPEADRLLKQDSGLENTLSHLVEEAVLNARIHGNAKQAIVWVRAIGAKRIHLIVADNGSGQPSTPKSGLGEAMFTAATESWSLLLSESKHTVLTAVLVSEK
jgi:signal transduction histidine kinase